MSPAYEARAAKALEMCKLVHGNDVTSPSAKKYYALCHKALIECNGNAEEAKKKIDSIPKG